MESNLRHILLETSSDQLPTHTPAAASLDAEASIRRKRSNATSRLAYPRKRAIRACQKCRVRRTKCDNVRPACTACVNLGAECVYSEGDPSTFDTASLAILDKLNTIEDLLRRSNPGNNPPSPHRNDSDATQTPASQVSATLSGILPEQPTPDEKRRMSIETVLSWPVFSDQSPNTYLKSLLNSTELDHATSAHADTTDEVIKYDELLQRFLDNVFIYNPVVEENTLQQYIRDIDFHGFGFDAKTCLLFLIYANGCLTFSAGLDHPADSMSFRHTSHFHRAEDFFRAAQKRMGLLLCKSTEIEAQCFFLAGVYLMTTLRPLEAWKMFVQALTCCQAFTVDRKLQDEGRNRTKRLQESIWWTCFKSELELRLELNVFENSIWDLTYPLEYPTPPEGLRTQREAVWYYYLAEIALRRLGNRILNAFHKTNQGQAKLDVKGVTDFEEQALGWISGLPPALNFQASPHPTDGGLYDNLKFVLEGHLLDCYEMMYWPFLTEIIFNGPPDGASRDLENLAYKSLYYCIRRIERNEHGFFNRHHGTWLMLRACTRSALVLIAAKRDPVLSSMLPDEWEQAVWKVTSMLKFWRKESRECDDRLMVIERCMYDIAQKKR